MNSTEIQNINRVIAEAMGPGLICIIDNLLYRMYDGLYFNPVDSISDVMEAVDKIFSEGQLEIILDRDSNESWTCSIWYYRDELYTAEAETPSAAISLALAEYLKEK